MNFLQEKPATILTELRKMDTKLCKENPTASNLAKRSDTTYAHAVKNLQDMKEEGLVTSEKKGREKHLSLTESGQKAAEQIKELQNTLNQGETA